MRKYTQCVSAYQKELKKAQGQTKGNSFVSAEEKKDGKCPCEKEKPKASVVAEEKKDGKCPCEKEKPKAAAGEEKKDGKCPCEKEKPKA